MKRYFIFRQGNEKQTARYLLFLFGVFAYMCQVAAIELPSKGWEFSNGPEFPGASGFLRYHGKGVLELIGDFSKGGSYVAVSRPLVNTTDLREFQFKIKGNATGMAVRFVDADGQTHQHFLSLTGDPSVWQSVEIPVAGSPNHHWGGKNDGILRGPIKRIGIVLHKHDFSAKTGSARFAELRISDMPAVKLPVWKVTDPAALFRYIDDNSPVQIQASFPEQPTSKQLSYSYRNYAGTEVAKGNATYDKTTRILSALPPVGRGFFELCYPELGIKIGLTVDDPPPVEVDEYFAFDSSLSWGPPPDDEKGIRDFIRILKKNGINWNRDRLHWPDIEKERGEFDFGGRFGLYRRIAEEEGVKGLDTFHSTPSWNLSRNTTGRWNPYPDNLLAAGESWSAIIKHWRALKALEVWNEPDINFGNNFPAEYVTAFTKAVSRSFADNGVDALVVGGVWAATRPDTNFYRTYIDNGLLDDSDIISYHSYAEVADMESQVAALRQVELDCRSPRAGIPYWITECGKPRPWTGTSRGPVEPDLYSAAEIAGKAAELRALGLERYFVFEYKFRKENKNNFGQMDVNRTPMRGMAAYLHLVRVLSHRDYIGDLKGSDALRARVFEGKNDLVVILYNGTRKNRKFSVALPAGLRVSHATGIDGRTLKVENGRVPNTDGITYLYLDKTAKKRFINSDTRAMKLYQLAKSYRPKRRAAKPLVLQPMTDISKLIVSNCGFYTPESNDLELKFRVNNFDKMSLEFVPKVELPPGAKLLTQPATLLIPAGEMAETAFRVSLAPDQKESVFQTFRVCDGKGNATPIAFALAPFRWQEVKLGAMPDGTKSPNTLAELQSLGNWNDFSGSANWTPCEGDKTIPDIEACFRGFYTSQELVIQVLVKDGQHVNPNSALESWRGDSVQLTIQQRKADKLPLGYKQYHEITAAKCGHGQTLYAHIGRPEGKLVKSKLEFRPLDNGHYLYEIRLDGKELGLELKPGSVIGCSMIVNSDPGSGRAGFLSWGLGITPDKSDTLFNLLVLK